MDSLVDGLKRFFDLDSTGQDRVIVVRQRWVGFRLATRLPHLHTPLAWRRPYRAGDRMVRFTHGALFVPQGATCITQALAFHVNEQQFIFSRLTRLSQATLNPIP